MVPWPMVMGKLRVAGDELMIVPGTFSAKTLLPPFLCGLRTPEPQKASISKAFP